MKRGFAGAVAAGCCGWAMAQSPQIFLQSTGKPVGLQYQLSWVEADPTTGLPVGNPNGALEPGEGALLKMTIVMTAELKTPVTWDPVIGGSGAGLLRGIQHMGMDLVSTPVNTGSWGHLLVDEIWDLMGPPGYGTSSQGGSVLLGVQAGQFWMSSNAFHASMAVNVWRGVWTPDDHQPRTAVFQCRRMEALPPQLSGSAAMLRDPAIPSSVFVGNLASLHGEVQIPVVPGPGGLIALAAGVWGARRRRAEVVRCFAAC